MMATYVWIGLLLVSVACYSQASLFSSEEEECLEPVENSYYLNGAFDEPCQRLAAAFIRYRDYVRTMVAEHSPNNEEAYQRSRTMALIYTGIDIDDDQQINDVACQLAGASTVEDVARLLNVSEYMDTLVNGYIYAQQFMARFDGFHGFRMGCEIWLAVSDQLRGKTVQMEEVEILIAADDLARVFHNLENEFGPGYLVYFLFRPYNDALVGVDHKLLAQAYLDKDIACGLGVSREIESEFYQRMGSLHSLLLDRQMTDIVYELYIAADQMGLFFLGLA